MVRRNNTAAMTEICLCAVCRKMLFEGDKLADHFKYDFGGELDYIELVHLQCGVDDNVLHPDYWRVDQK